MTSCVELEKKNERRDRSLYGALFLLAMAGFPSKQSTLALLALVRKARRCLLISWTNPASNFGRAGRSFLRPRTIGDFREKSNKSCLSLTVKRISGPSKEINLQFSMSSLDQFDGTPSRVDSS
jgi:hypothetical protein